MSVLFLGIAVVITLLVVTGWVLLLTMPWVVLSATTVGAVARGAARAKRALPAFSGGAARGVLAIEGLASEPGLARRLHSDLVRVLKLAAPSTRPRACACVKESEGGFIGVLRVFNAKGHYLLRTSGASAAAVATRISSALGEFEDVFPAKEGARRVACPECQAKTCPLVRRKRERALAAA